MTHNLIRVDLITKIAYFSVAAAALTFVSMLLLTTLHPKVSPVSNSTLTDLSGIAAG